jgi:hypothetical protein
MRKLLLLTAVFAFVAAAADITGTWKASMETPNGTRETTFVFKADGDTLTGTVAGGRGGEAPIENGKIKGDKVSFTVTRKFQDREFKQEFKGKVDGDSMKLSFQMGERAIEMTAKKQ